MVGVEPQLTMGDQGPQRVGPDQLMQRSGPGDGEMGWQIHKRSWFLVEVRTNPVGMLP